MTRFLPQKASTLLLVFIYAAAIILATSCFGDRGGSNHSHHQSPAAHHTSWCLFACATTAAGSVSPALPFSFFLFSSLLVFYSALFQFQRAARSTRDRAPPLL